MPKGRSSPLHQAPCGHHNACGSEGAAEYREFTSFDGFHFRPLREMAGPSFSLQGPRQFRSNAAARRTRASRAGEIRRAAHVARRSHVMRPSSIA